MRYIISFGLAILLSSCATTTANYYPQTVQSWRGGNARSLVARWGAPDRTVTTSHGNTVYLYQTQSYRNLNAPSAPMIGVNVNREGRPILASSSPANMTWNRGAMSLTCVAAFEIAKNGTILNTQIQGSSCYGSERFKERMANPGK